MTGREGKLVAVAGSPGCGKTLTSLKLALALESRGKDVLVFALESAPPPLSYLLACPPGPRQSLGALLARPQTGPADILRACLPVPGHRRVALIGYLPGESLSDYPAPQAGRIRGVYEKARRAADFVLLDCAAGAEGSPATLQALREADAVLELACADPKSVSYRRCLERLRQDLDRRPGQETLTVLNNAAAGQPWEEAVSLLGALHTAVPQCAAVARQYREMALWEPPEGREGRHYTERIARIAGLLLPAQEQAAAGGKRGKRKREQGKERAAAGTGPEKSRITAWRKAPPRPFPLWEDAQGAAAQNNGKGGSRDGTDRPQA
ncbi:MAG: hypothetical protein LBQ15_02830 [Clostridium sp.]|jgi:MinD-like ATPase involved in chromosome partitioning or flagellar assembly|nr:hypothetical protein [Clostridium sp.]